MSEQGHFRIGSPEKQLSFVDLVLTKDESGCNHFIKVISAYDLPVAFVCESGGMVTTGSQLTSFTHCPKCGEKL